MRVKFKLLTGILFTLFIANVQAHTSFAPVSMVSEELVSVQHSAFLMTEPNVSNGNVSELHIINTSNASQQFFGTRIGGVFVGPEGK